MPNPLYNFLQTNGLILPSDGDMNPLKSKTNHYTDKHNRSFYLVYIDESTIQDLKTTILLDQTLHKDGVVINLINDKCRIQVFSEPHSKVSNGKCMVQLTFAYTQAMIADKLQYINFGYDPNGNIIDVNSTQPNITNIYHAIQRAQQFTDVDTAIKKLFKLCNKAISEQQHIAARIAETMQQQASTMPNPPVMTPLFSRTYAPAADPISLQLCKRFAALMIAFPHTNPLTIFHKSSLYGAKNDMISEFMAHMNDDEANKTYARICAAKENFIDARNLVYNKLVALNCEPYILNFIQRAFDLLNQAVTSVDLLALQLAPYSKACLNR